MESESWTLTIWYKHPLETILQDFKQEMVQPEGIEFSPFHSKTGSLGKLNLTTLILQYIEEKQECNQSIPNVTSKSNISSYTSST